MVMIEFSTPLKEVFRKYLPTDTKEESKMIVNNLRTIADDRLFRVEQAWHVSADFRCTPL